MWGDGRTAKILALPPFSPIAHPFHVFRHFRALFFPMQFPVAFCIGKSGQCPHHPACRSRPSWCVGGLAITGPVWWLYGMRLADVDGVIYCSMRAFSEFTRQSRWMRSCETDSTNVLRSVHIIFYKTASATVGSCGCCVHTCLLLFAELFHCVDHLDTCGRSQRSQSPIKLARLVHAQ